MNYYAHTAFDPLKWELQAVHARRVADRASTFAAALGSEAEARAAGLLHDLGKYGELFQQRLRDRRVHGVDHWSAGAWALLREYNTKGIAAALAVEGHHVGLQPAPTPCATCSAKERLEALSQGRPHLSQGVRLSREDMPSLRARFDSDGLRLPAIAFPLYERTQFDNALMLDIRMFYSALVDADFLATEEFMWSVEIPPRQPRTVGPSLDAERALNAVLARIETLGRNTQASATVAQMRTDLLAACLSAAEGERGLFTLSAPTGSGKTLAMLAFALAHARRHGLRRVIVAVPFLSVIEQTAHVYRDEVFGPAGFPNDYVLEHHSLAGVREAFHDREDVDSENESLLNERLAVENWDAPIVLTTTVQLLESLFASRPAACRKLHRIARSVMLFDEAQTLPLCLSLPTLGALSRLVERYECSVVMATATQPAFEHLNEEVSKHVRSGWRTRKVVSVALNLFGRVSRVETHWPAQDERLNWCAVAARVAARPQALCIVNLKRHAVDIAQKVRDVLDGEGENKNTVFHLSTQMCPAHRRAVLETIRHRLKEGEPCRLIATQCVEAGVDIDFPVVWRAWAPLDSLAQAAGRCNREGKPGTTGEFQVFDPDPDGRVMYPPGSYEQAAEVTRAFLYGSMHKKPWDLQSPELFDAYYRFLYDITRQWVGAEDLTEAIKRRDFPEVARLYRVIPDNTLSILVPYDVPRWKALADEVREQGLTGDWTRRAQLHSVNSFRKDGGRRTANNPLWDYVEPVPLGGRGRCTGSMSEDWFIYLRDGEEHYSSLLGLIPSGNMETLIG